MKVKADNLLFFCLTAALTLFAAEFLIDLWFGDGDGSITNYGLHSIILSVQWLLLSLSFILFVRKSISHLFRKEKGVLPRIGKATLFLVYLTALFLLLELFSRIAAPSEGTFDRIYQAENARYPVPYAMFKAKPGSLTGYGDEVYNRQGFRGKYPSIPKPKDEFRLIVLGGSTVWEGDTMLTGFLETELKKNDLPAASVYNMGVVGANSSMQWIILVNEAIHLQPDLIITYDGANDIIHPLHYDPRPGYPFNFLIYENNPFLMKSFPALTLLAYKSNLFRLLMRKYLAEHISHQTLLRKEAGYKSEAWRNKIAEVYLTNKRLTLQQCRLMNIRYLNFFQPTVYTKRTLSADEKKYVEERAEEKQQVEMLNRLITSGATNDSLLASRFYDLSDVFDSVEVQLYRDNVHLSNEGRNLIAQRMASVIIHEMHKQGD